MKLRIARKMDTGGWKQRRRKDREFRKRVWWHVYTDEQLTRAERRLRKSWTTRRVASFDDEGRKMWTLVPDWFAANRVESRLIRQRALRRMGK